AVELLEDDDAQVVRAAWEFLVRAGPEAAAAVPRPELLFEVTSEWGPFGREVVLRSAGRFGVAALPWLRAQIEAPAPRDLRALARRAPADPAISAAGETQRYVRELYDGEDDTDLHAAVVGILGPFPAIAAETRSEWLAAWFPTPSGLRLLAEVGTRE